jgi:hypothetical protein
MDEKSEDNELNEDEDKALRILKESFFYYI